MLIDNVGLHRIFGLPVRDRDWEAMFEGRMAGNAQPRTRMENNGLSVSVPLPEDGRRNEELEVVMTHARLLDAVRNGDLVRLGVICKFSCAFFRKVKYATEYTGN